MAEGVELATAYVTIIPSLRGATKQIEDQLGGVGVKSAGEKIGKGLGESIGKGIDAKAIGAKLESIGDGLSSAGSKLSSIGGTLTTAVTTPILGATAAVGAFALSTASAAETSEMAFTTMLGGAEQAQEMLDTLAEFAAHTPFELSGLISSTQQLLAYGFAAEDVIPMLTAVGDATAALGSGEVGIQAVTRALGQMRTKGKVSAEEMLQLTEQGIPAWEYLARAIGTDTAGAMEQVSKGAVTAQQGIDALTQGMEQDFGGMMEAQSKTVEGIMSNIADSFEQPLMKLRETDAYDDFAAALERIADSAGPFVESLLPHLESGLDLVTGVLDAATGAMDAFSEMSEESQSQILGLVAGAAAAGPALKVAGEGMELLGSVTKTAGKALEKTPDIFGKLTGALGDLGTPLTTYVTGLGAAAGPAAVLATVVGGTLVGALGLLAAEAEEARQHEELMADVTMSTADIFADAADGAGELGDAIGGIEPDVSGTLDAIRDLNQSVSETFEDVFKDSSRLDQYVGVIDELGNKSGLSATEQYRLKEAVEGYNSIVGTQYEVIDAANGKIADQSGVVQENTDLLRENAEAWKNRAYSEAMSSVAAEYMEAEAKAAYELQVAQEGLTEAIERRDQAALIANGTVEASAEEVAAAQAEWDRLNREIPEMEQNVSDLGAAHESAAQKANDFSNAAAVQSAVFGTLGDRSQEFVTALTATGVGLETFAGLTDQQLATVASSWDGTTSSIITSLAGLGVSIPASAYEGMLGLTSALSQGGSEAISCALTVAGMTAQQFADAAAQYGINGAASITAFANALSNGASVEQAAAIAQETAAAIGEGDFVTPGSQAAADYAAGISGNASAATGAASSMASSAKAALDSVDGYSSGAHLGAQFAAGLDSQYVAVAGAAQRISDAAAKCLVFSVPEEGPFSGAERGGERSGEHLGQNFARGLESEADEVGQAAEAVADAAYEVVSARELPSYDAEGFLKSMDAAVSTVSKLGESMSKAKDEASKDVGSWLTDIADSADELSKRRKNLESVGKLLSRTGVAFSEKFVAEIVSGSETYGEHISYMADLTDSKLQAIADLYDYSKVTEKTLDLAEALASDSGLASAFEATGQELNLFAADMVEFGYDVDDITSKVEDFAGSVADGWKVLNKYDSGTLDDFVYGLRKNIKASKEWAENVEEVFSKVADYGPSEAFRKEILEGGFDEYAQMMYQLSKATREEIIKVIDLWNEAMAQGQNAAMSVVGSLMPDADKMAGVSLMSVDQTINFNQPVSTPSQTANVMRRYVTYGLAGAR